MARIEHFNNPNAPKPNSIVVAVTVFVQDKRGRVLLIQRTDKRPVGSAGWCPGFRRVHLRDGRTGDPRGDRRRD